MRPVRRGPPPSTTFADYDDAKTELVSRLGSYCSYCERKIVTVLAVEHIQPKGHPQYAALRLSWDNFLLACTNCNSTKGDKDVVLSDVALPDRDNTFAAFEYRPDGVVAPNPNNPAPIQQLAQNTLALVGLDKPIQQFFDENGKAVALDRVAQRMEAWAKDQEALNDLANARNVPALERAIIRLAQETGFFSIWMEVFKNHPSMLKALILAFQGTVSSGCFNSHGAPVTPAPNPDNLPHGGKV